jgi:hypothetical protein
VVSISYFRARVVRGFHYWNRVRSNPSIDPHHFRDCESVASCIGVDEEVAMASLSKPRCEICPRCSSWVVSLEWSERINEQEVQKVWHCWECHNEFTTLNASVETAQPSVDEIQRPFFTSLLME